MRGTGGDRRRRCVLWGAIFAVLGVLCVTLVVWVEQRSETVVKARSSPLSVEPPPSQGAVPALKTEIREGDSVLLSFRTCGPSHADVRPCREPTGLREPHPFCSMGEGLCQRSSPPKLRPVPTFIKVVLVASSPNLVVHSLEQGDEPLYSLHQRMQWFWSVTAKRPGTYFLKLAVIIVDPGAGISITVQKFIVRVVVVRGTAERFTAVIREAKNGINWLIGAVGLLGIGSLLVERFLFSRRALEAPGAPTCSANGVDSEGRGSAEGRAT